MDVASPFPSDHHPVVWDTPGMLQEEVRPPVVLRALNFQVQDLGVPSAYHTVLAWDCQAHPLQSEDSEGV